MTEVNPTFAWALMSSGGLLAADPSGRAHVYNTEEQAWVEQLAAEVHTQSRLVVALVAIVPVEDDE